MRLVCLTLVLCFVACKKDAPSTTSTTSAVATTSTNDHGNIRHSTATARISGSRCDREDVCDPFGVGKRFDGRVSCDNAEYARARAELKESDCPNGIDGKALHACLEALEQRDCTMLGDRLESIEPCVPASLCPPRP